METVMKSSRTILSTGKETVNEVKPSRNLLHATKQGFFVRPRPMRAVAALVLAAAALSTVGCAKKVSVPNLVQMDVDQAKAMLTAVPLKPGTVSSAQGAVVPGAYVVSQNPPAGQQVPANTTVDLTVELPVPVPNLVNSNLADAVNMLQSVGLKVMLVKHPSANPFGKSKVVLQDPPANAPVRHDATIMLTVTAPPDLSAFLGAVAKDPAYQKLNPEYRSVLDGFMK